MCHRGLRFCDAPVENIPKNYNKESILEHFNAYPEQEDEILATWEERARAWESIDRSGAGRLMTCGWSKNIYEHITAEY
jgi:hypothetical protein